MVFQAMILPCKSGKVWANELNFVMNHAPGAGSIRPVDLKSSILPLC